MDDLNHHCVCKILVEVNLLAGPLYGPICYSLTGIKNLLREHSKDLLYFVCF